MHNIILLCVLQSWEAVESSASTFTPDITPLTLAAHMNNYEILKILLDRGATLPMPHDVRFVRHKLQYDTCFLQTFNIH